MDVRDKILRAAVTVFAEVGFRGATTRRIAQEAGVNEITLFRHFGSKDRLLHEAISRSDLAPAAAELPGEPRRPRAELLAWVKEHYEHLIQRRSLICTCLAEMSEHPEIIPPNNPSARAVEQLRDYLRKLRSGGFTNVTFDAEIVAPDAARGAVLGRDGPAVRAGRVPEGAGEDAGGVCRLFPARASGWRSMRRDYGMRRRHDAAYRRIVASSHLFLGMLAVSAPVAAQQAGARPVSLEEAISMAAPASEILELARASVYRARGEQYRQGWERWPQLSGTLGFSRLLKSQFEGFSFGGDSTGGGPTRGRPASCPSARRTPSTWAST